MCLFQMWILWMLQEQEWPMQMSFELSKLSNLTSEFAPKWDDISNTKCALSIWNNFNINCIFLFLDVSFVFPNVICEIQYSRYVILLFPFFDFFLFSWLVSFEVEATYFLHEGHRNLSFHLLSKKGHIHDLLTIEEKKSFWSSRFSVFLEISFVWGDDIFPGGQCAVKSDPLLLLLWKVF